MKTQYSKNDGHAQANEEQKQRAQEWKDQKAAEKAAQEAAKAGKR